MMKKYSLILFLSAAVCCLNAAGTLSRGDGTETSWQKTASSTLIRWQTNEIQEIPTTAKFAYDDSRLYVQVNCTEPNLTEARQAVRYTRHDAPVWGNECVELFITFPEMAPAYYQLVVDIHNQAADMRNNDPAFPRPLEWNAYWSHSVKYHSTGYTVNFTIPWKSLGRAPGKNRTLQLNISRMRYISPASRSVLSPRTTKQLHNIENYLCFNGIDIAPPVLSATASITSPQEGKNRMTLNISSVAGKTLSGAVEIKTANSAGIEKIRKIIPVTIPAKTTVKTIFDWIQPEAGFFPLRAVFKGDDNTVCDLYETTLRFNRPLELNEDHPLTAAGKDYHVYTRIFAPGEKHQISVKITDTAKRTVARSSIICQGKEFFLPLPCAKLHPGHYNVEVTLNKSFTAKMKLWINPEIIR